MWQFLISIYGSFTNTVSSQGYIALNGRITVNNELERVWVGVVISGTILAFTWTEKGKTMQTSSNCTQQGTQIHGSHIHLLLNFSYIFWP
jgi:hypothetical protein